MKIILEELSEVFMFNFDKIIISEQKNESLTQEEIDKELKKISSTI